MTVSGDTWTKESEVNLALTGLRLRKYIVQRSVRFRTAGEVKSAVYDCLVPFDDKKRENQSKSIHTVVCYNYY